MIDCDIHHSVGDVDEFLTYDEPGQRDWFRAQGPLLGLPGYPGLAEQTDTAHHITTTWDYDGHRPLTQLERRTSPGHQPQSQIDARFFAIVTDLVGAPSELVDEQGAIAWRGRSTAWGTTSWNRDAAAYTPLRLPGQYDDAETGFYYNYQRHYDPDTARYASPDPLGLGPAPNPVAYVTNPHTRMDPEGLIAKGCTENGGWYSGL